MKRTAIVLSLIVLASSSISSYPVAASENASAENSGAFSEQGKVLVDSDAIKVTLEDEVDGSNYAGYSLIIENKTDEYISVSVDNASVDGYMTSIFINDGQVNPGMKSKAEMQIYYDNQPNVKSLDDLKNIQAAFKYNSNTDGGNSYTGNDSVYPFEITGHVGSQESDAQSDQSQGRVLLDTDLAKITLGDTVEGSNYIGYAVQIENKSSDTYISVNLTNTSIDGFMTDMFLDGGRLSPGMKSNAEMKIYTEDSDVKSLDDLKNVQGSFEINTNIDGTNSYAVSGDAYPFTISDASQVSMETAENPSDSDPAAAETESAEDALDAALGQANEAMDITGEAADTAAQAEQTEAPAKEYETLQEGSNGDGVVALQQALIDQGFLTGAADGAYGAGTAASVKAFQESMGLQATGIADSQTQNLLFNGMDVSDIEVKVTGTARTDYMNIDGMFTDESYVAEESSSLTVLYLFYTVTTNDQNLQIFGGSTDLTINGANTYDRTRLNNIGIYFGNYYYTNYGHDVYMGDEVRILETFRIPKADLAPGRTITLSNDYIPETDQIRLVTDDIIPLNGPRMISKVIDPEGYEIASEKLAPADDELMARVKNEIMGTWNVTAGILSLQIEFGDGTYTLYTQISTASGTYEITNGYVILTESTSGGKIYAPYSFGDNGSFDFGIAHAFDPDAM